MPTFYYIQIQGSGISLCCNLMITRPHNYVKENVQNLGIKNVRDQVERDLQIFFLWTMQKWQLLEVGFELFSWSWIPCRKKKMHFCVKLKRKGNSSNGWVCILQKKGNKTNAWWGKFALFAKRLKWNHKCKNRDSKGYETYYGTKMRLQQEEDGIHMSWSHSNHKTQNGLSLPCVFTRIAHTSELHPMWVLWRNGVGIVKQWVGFCKKEKKGTPIAQGMYIDSISCLPIPPLQVLKDFPKTPSKTLNLGGHTI